MLYGGNRKDGVTIMDELSNFHGKGLAAWMVLAACLLVPCAATADVVPLPQMGNFPLHRIGIEIVLEVVAAAAGGLAAMRWLVKRGWKKEEMVTGSERAEIEERLNAIVPEIRRAMTAHPPREPNCQRCGTHLNDRTRFCPFCGAKVVEPQSFLKRFEECFDKDALEDFLRGAPEITRKLEGIPIEMLAKTLAGDKSEFLICNMYWASDQEEQEWNAKVQKHRPRPTLPIFLPHPRYDDDDAALRALKRIETEREKLEAAMKMEGERSGNG